MTINSKSHFLFTSTILLVTTVNAVIELVAQQLSINTLQRGTLVRGWRACWAGCNTKLIW